MTTKNYFVEVPRAEPAEFSWTLRPFQGRRVDGVDPPTFLQSGNAIYFASNTVKGTYLCFGGSLLRFDEEVWGKDMTIVDRASPCLILRNWYIIGV
jgi:hypothetical protein